MMCLLSRARLGREYHCRVAEIRPYSISVCVAPGMLGSQKWHISDGQKCASYGTMCTIAKFSTMYTTECAILGSMSTMVTIERP